MANKPGAGRPSKYRNDFHPDDYVEQCKRGKTKAQICSIWDIDGDTLVEWAKKHKDFSAAVRLGKSHARAFWIQLAFAAMVGEATFNGRHVNVDYRYFNWIMMNCFGIGKEKKALPLSEELKKIIEMAKDLKKLPESELIKIAEKELAKVKK